MDVDGDGWNGVVDILFSFTLTVTFIYFRSFIQVYSVTWNKVNG